MHRMSVISTAYRYPLPNDLQKEIDLYPHKKTQLLYEEFQAIKGSMVYDICSVARLHFTFYFAFI